MVTQTSTNTGKAYQNASTFLFVPQSYGDTGTAADDVNTPGAYFRLGGFSDIENSAGPTASNAAGGLAPFYPRQHITDETASSAVANAAGAGTDPRGIMLACSGRLLIRAAEKTYLHSTGDIHIDTQGTLTANAEGAMTIKSNATIGITSGTDQEITISAGGGTGDITMTAKQSTKTVNGEEYSYVTENTYSYFKADAYSYRLGGSVDVALGGAFAFWLGVKLSISTSVETQISLAILIGITAYKLDIAGLAVEFTQAKVDLKETELSFAALRGDNSVLKAEAAAAKTEADLVKAETAQVVAQFTAVKNAVAGVRAQAGGPDVQMQALIAAI